MRRAGRPESCTIDAADDVCLGCPHKMPPCAGIGARRLCPAVIAEARGGKPRGSLDDAIRQAQGSPPRPRGLLPDLAAETFVSAERLTRDTLTLIRHLPADVDLVVAIPRSGLLPGSLAAYQLHVPLLTVSRQRGVTDPGHGRRLEGPRPDPRHVLLIDDTVAGGNEMRHNFPVVRAAYPDARITRAAVYAHPRAADVVDLFAAYYPGEHYLEWNWANAGHGAWTAYDMDGLICDDCPVPDDDDGPRYARFLRETRPLCLPRRATIPLIVTGRHRKYRDATRAWLDRHGVRAERIEMRDWAVDPSRAWHEQHGEFKAAHYGPSGCGYFAESCPLQAEVIHRLTGKPVICPALGKVLGAPG